MGVGFNTGFTQDPYAGFLSSSSGSSVNNLEPEHIIKAREQNQKKKEMPPPLELTLQPIPLEVIKAARSSVNIVNKQILIDSKIPDLAMELAQQPETTEAKIKTNIEKQYPMATPAQKQRLIALTMFAWHALKEPGNEPKQIKQKLSDLNNLLQKYEQAKPNERILISRYLFEKGFNTSAQFLPDGSYAKSNYVSNLYDLVGQDIYQRISETRANGLTFANPITLSDFNNSIQGTKELLINEQQSLIDWSSSILLKKQMESKLLPVFLAKLSEISRNTPDLSFTQIKDIYADFCKQNNIQNIEQIDRTLSGLDPANALLNMDEATMFDDTAATTNTSSEEPKIKLSDLSKAIQSVNEDDEISKSLFNAMNCLNSLLDDPEYLTTAKDNIKNVDFLSLASNLSGSEVQLKLAVLLKTIDTKLKYENVASTPKSKEVFQKVTENTIAIAQNEPENKTAQKLAKELSTLAIEQNFVKDLSKSAQEFVINTAQAMAIEEIGKTNAATAATIKENIQQTTAIREAIQTILRAIIVSRDISTVLLKDRGKEETKKEKEIEQNRLEFPNQVAKKLNLPPILVKKVLASLGLNPETIDGAVLRRLIERFA